jgi:hypothetical protein
MLMQFCRFELQTRGLYHFCLLALWPSEVSGRKNEVFAKRYRTVAYGHEAYMHNLLAGKGNHNVLQCHVIKNNLIGNFLGAKINVIFQNSGSCAKPTAVMISASNSGCVYVQLRKRALYS